MAWLDIPRKVWGGMRALGGKRLVALGLTGLTVFVTVTVSGYLLNRPRQEVLYASLDSQDVSRIGAVLNDSGIGFDINVGGDTVLVEYGQAARARMMLAQKGLPRSDSAGYELFDKLGSLGLTTFMQQITKVRALEGELARTIQLIDGIKAARVHLALKSEGNFRGGGDQATASVVIRADRDAGEHAANSIRHLVAAAIPGLAISQVTVMSADGTLLASIDDPASAAPEKLMGLERSVSADIEARIARTMAPLLGYGNYRISVSAKLNADRKQTSETAFDPNSRVERSVRTIKESGEAFNAAGGTGVTVEQNVPVEETAKGNADNSSEKKDRKEELTNYEVNSKSTSTTSEGYAVERLSVALVINKPMLMKMLGDNPSEEGAKQKILELREIAASASGLVEARGDVIAVSAADFVDEDAIVSEVNAGSTFELIGGNLGNLINSGTMILVTLLVLMLGLRPALRSILSDRMLSEGAGPPALADLSGPGGAALPVVGMTTDAGARAPIGAAQLGHIQGDPVVEKLTKDATNGPRDRLAKIVDLDHDRAVEVLKKWLNEPAEMTT